MSDEEDKRQIREVIATWLRASQEGVVFLLPGREPMRGRENFAAASRAMGGKVRFEGRPEIQEIEIAGDYAYCWNYLSVTITPLPEGTPMRKAGHVLSVFRREVDGRWVLFRDANMLMAV